METYPKNCRGGFQTRPSPVLRPPSPPRGQNQRMRRSRKPFKKPPPRRRGAGGKRAGEDRTAPKNAGGFGTRPYKKILQNTKIILDNLLILWYNTHIRRKRPNPPSSHFLRSVRPGVPGGRSPLGGGGAMPAPDYARRRVSRPTAAQRRLLGRDGRPEGARGKAASATTRPCAEQNSRKTSGQKPAGFSRRSSARIPLALEGRKAAFQTSAYS